jgi:hypothetical protein
LIGPTLVYPGQPIDKHLIGQHLIKHLINHVMKHLMNHLMKHLMKYLIGWKLKPRLWENIFFANGGTLDIAFQIKKPAGSSASFCLSLHNKTINQMDRLDVGLGSNT